MQKANKVITLVKVFIADIWVRNKLLLQKKSITTLVVKFSCKVIKNHVIAFGS